MRTISLKVSESLDVRLRAAARKRRTSKSAFVRNALEAALEQPRAGQERSVYDSIRHLAGCIKGGPRDISYNKKYMRGFGK